MDYLAAIESVTNKTALEDLRSRFEADLQAGRINYQAYQVIFDAYIKKSGALTAGGGGTTAPTTGDLNIGGLGTRFGPTRAEALTRQEEISPGDVFSRYLQTLPGYQGATGYVQRAMEQKYAPARAQYDLMGAFEPTKQTFGQFLGGAQPSLGQMQSNLRRLTTTLGLPEGSANLPEGVGITPEGKPMPGVEEVLRERYGSQTEEGQNRQFQASIQPLLAQMAPAFRQAFQSGAAGRAGRFMAAKPETDWLAEARRLGYF